MSSFRKTQPQNSGQSLTLEDAPPTNYYFISNVNHYKVLQNTVQEQPSIKKSKIGLRSLRQKHYLKKKQMKEHIDKLSQVPTTNTPPQESHQLYQQFRPSKSSVMEHEVYLPSSPTHH